MKSKTLALFETYTLRLEAGEDLTQAPDPNAAPSPDVTENPAPAPPAEGETVPLSSPAELRYIEDVVLAALMEPPSGNDRIKLENILDLIKRPDADSEIQKQGISARDLYESDVLPIIRPAQQNDDIRNISDQMSN